MAGWWIVGLMVLCPSVPAAGEPQGGGVRGGVEVAGTAGRMSAAARGEALAAEGQLVAAMEQFEAVLVSGSRDAEGDGVMERARQDEEKAVVQVALQRRGAGDGAGALQVLEHGRTVLPGSVEILTDLGVQAQEMHRLKEAGEALRAALALEPGSGRALYGLARVAMDQEHFPEAEGLFRRYVAQVPGDASAHYGLGRLLQMQMRRGEAAAEFERSIALQPVQTEAYYQMGQMALDAGEADRARAAFEKTLERLPVHGGALTGMGVLAYKQKRYDEAEGWLSKAVKAAPEYQPGHYYLGLTLGRMGRKEASAAELKVAADLAAAQQGKGKPVDAEGVPMGGVAGDGSSTAGRGQDDWPPR